MADARNDDIGLLGLDLVEKRSKVARIGREAHVVEHLHADFRQALHVFRVERRRHAASSLKITAVLIEYWGCIVCLIASQTESANAEGHR
jgi:hypothetical protein